MAERRQEQKDGITGCPKARMVGPDRISARAEEELRRFHVGPGVAEPQAAGADECDAREAEAQGGEKDRPLPGRGEGPRRFGALAQGQASEKLPASSVFLISAMNWSATAPSISR